MNKKQRAVIKQILYDVEKQELAHFEALPELPFTPSETYNERIREQLAQVQHPKRVSRSHRGVWLVAAVLALTVAATACVFHKEIKAFFTSVYRTFSTFFDVEDEIKTDIETRYLFTQVLEEYEIVQEYLSQMVCKTTYSNGTKCMYFTQASASSDKMNLDTEDVVYQTKTVGDVTLYYAAKHDMYAIVWCTEDYNFSLVCPADIPWEEIEKMIGSLAPVQP